MSISALTGKDTIEIGGRVFVDFGDGDVVNFTYPNELVTPKTGKNGNSIYAFNETGKQVDCVLRILRGSPDDKFLTSSITVADEDPVSASGISNTPVDGCYVAVYINGIEYEVGNGVKTTTCYFSGDGGTTPRGFSSGHANGQVQKIGRAHV